MTTRPRPIPFDRALLPGLIAVALFVLMAAVFLNQEFVEPAGFDDVSIVVGIGYAIIGAAEQAGEYAVYEGTENFLVALILVAIVLDAALDGALMLAKRDEGGDGR